MTTKDRPAFVWPKEAFPGEQRIREIRGKVQNELYRIPSRFRGAQLARMEQFQHELAEAIDQLFDEQLEREKALAQQNHKAD